MGRKAHYINHVSDRDIEAFRILFNCQHVPRDLLRISDNRLESYRKEGIITVCRTLENNQPVIKFTDKGYSYIKKLDDFKGRVPYKSTTAAQHNMKLAEIYSKLSREDQLNWKTEKELNLYYNERMEYLREHEHDRYEELRDLKVSTADGGVVVSGQVTMLYEIVTGSYGQAELEAHEAYAEVLDTQITMERA